ncbi:MAG: hypothetical protein ABIT58_03125 [Ferruginibacter sp.]
MDIIALILLVIYIGKKAKEKGLNPGPWRLRLILTWLLFEFAGFFIGAALFNVNVSRMLAGKMDELSGLALFAFVCAFGGFLLVKRRLDKTASNLDDQIDDIGKGE